MPQKTLQSLGRLVRDRRGDKRLKEVATSIGISAPTLMRVENGRVPDVTTFLKLCNWLQISPADFGYTPDSEKKKSQKDHQAMMISAHLKGDKTPNEDTVRALIQMLLLATSMQGVREDLEDKPV